MEVLSILTRVLFWCSPAKRGSPGPGAWGGGFRRLALTSAAAVCTGAGAWVAAWAGPGPVTPPQVPVQVNPVFPEPGAPEFKFPVGTPVDGGGGGGDGGGKGVDGATIAHDYQGLEGQVVGSGQCVALAQATSDVGLTATWSPGDLVQGNNDLAYGTVIATFGPDGDYTNTPGQSHTAIYLGQDDAGIWVEDQWVGQVAHERHIDWVTNNPYEGGGKFHVVDHA
jgi:hypothetical protein